MTTTASKSVTSTATKDDTTDVVYQEPIVIKKKNKKKYSRNLQDIQKFEVAVTKGSRRLLKAIDEGMSSWIDSRDKSANKKKDGAIRDSLKNHNKALGKFNKAVADIPNNIINDVLKIKMLKRLYR